jgi:hypothetical protein
MDNYNTPILKNMGSHMKTTLDLADPLFHAAKAMAAQQKTTLRALVEEGLRLVMEQRKKSAVKPYVLPDCRAGAGAEVLVSDPKQWRELETEWLIDSMKLDQSVRSPKPETRA